MKRFLCVLACLAWLIPAVSGAAGGRQPQRAAAATARTRPRLARWAPSRAIRLRHGDRVEGSSRAGGLQPDYLIDLGSRPMRSLLSKARKLGRSQGDFWTRVAAVRDLVRAALPRRGYQDPRYLALLSRYRERGQPVPLGEYLSKGAGVCREHNMLVHLALEEAGVPNRYVYAKVEHDGMKEDHGFVVVERGDRSFIVDGYFASFDGAPLAQARAFKSTLPGGARILEVRPFPRQWSADSAPPTP